MSEMPRTDRKIANTNSVNEWEPAEVPIKAAYGVCSLHIALPKFCDEKENAFMINELRRFQCGSFHKQ